MDKFKNIVKDTMYTSKDVTNSKVFKTIINQVIKSYGTVLAFKIDSKDRSFLIELMLKGEIKPIRIEINKYEFVRHGDSTSVIIYSLTANREWMQTIMDFAVLNKEFELPKKFDTPIQAFM
jgi:hypothetical protein